MAVLYNHFKNIDYIKPAFFSSTQSLSARLKMIPHFFLSLSILFLATFFLSSPSYAAPEETATSVAVAPLKTLLSQRQSEIPAQVIALRESQVTSQVSGIVKEIFRESGHTVQKGEKLLQLDHWNEQYKLSQERAQLNKIEAQLKLADNQLKRAHKLRKKGQATKEKLDILHYEQAALRAEITQQKSRIATTKRRLKEYTITAPFAGLLTHRKTNLGRWINPGDPLFHLTDPTSVILSAQLSSFDKIAFDQGEAWFFIHQNRRYPLSQKQLIPAYHPINQTLTIRFSFSQKSPLPGTRGLLTWQDKRPFIKDQYLIQRKKDLGLFIAKNDQAHFIPLKAAQEGWGAYPTNIDLEEKIIIRGQENLNHNDKIRYTPTE
ncbi:efflux RND transporter periplasmic adaptor subunit [Magnetococcales bacterium HHB-1]